MWWQVVGLHGEHMVPIWCFMQRASCLLKASCQQRAPLYRGPLVFKMGLHLQIGFCKTSIRDVNWTTSCKVKSMIYHVWLLKKVCRITIGSLLILQSGRGTGPAGPLRGCARVRATNSAFLCRDTILMVGPYIYRPTAVQLGPPAIVHQLLTETAADQSSD